MELYNKKLESIEEIVKDIRLNKIISIDQRGVNIDILKQINNSISNSDDIKLILVCDYTVKVKLDYTNNLEVLLYLNNITKLVVLNHSPIFLSALDNIDKIDYLEEFTLKGYIKQSIKLDSLFKYNLKLLDLDLNATSSIYHLISLNKKIECLRIKSIDIIRTEKNENLKELEIRDSVINYELINSKFPLLETIRLCNVKKINDFSFFLQLKKIKNISLRNSNITSFPNLNIEKINRIELISNKKLNNISAILKLKSIMKLFISQCDMIPSCSLESCVYIEGLEQFYFFSLKRKVQLTINEKIDELNIKRSSTDFWN